MVAAVYRSVLFHDDSKLFVFAYVGLAVVLAIWLGLFWLAAVVGVHFLIELVKQHHYDPRPLPILTRSLWELKLDIGLVVFGLVIAVYMGIILGAAGIGAAARVGAQAAARAGIWQRALRGILLTVDDVALVVKTRSIASGRNGPAANGLASGTTEGNMEGRAGGAGDGPDDDPRGAEADRVRDAPSTDPAGIAVLAPPHPPPEPPAGGPALWGGWAAPRWSRGDRFSLAFTALSVLLVLAAPLLTHHTVDTAWAEIVNEMRPFPEHVIEP
jgi:hypothetical protein